MLNFRTPRLLAAAALAAVVGACTGDSPTTGPADAPERVPDARSFAATWGFTPTGETSVLVCKISLIDFNGGTDPNLGMSFGFSSNAAGSATFSIPMQGWDARTSADCRVVYDGTAGAEVVITEDAMPGVSLNSIFSERGSFNGGFPRPDLGVVTDVATRTATVTTTVADGTGVTIVYFKNEVTDTPDPLDVEKTANASYDRTYRWDLRKSVNPDAHSGVPGDAFQSIWTVTATKFSGNDNFQVSGQITVTNSNDFDVPFSLTDVLDDGTSASIVCPVGDNTGTVPANGSVNCSYTASPPDATATSNTVTVISDVGSDTDTETFSWTVNVIGDNEVTLSDPRVSYSSLISGSTTELFPEQFVCPTDLTVYVDGMWQETYPNTAFLDGANTDLEASAQVTVTCRVPDYEGCTPGYWRQEQHFGNWTGYATDQLFADVFGVAYEGTLLDAVWARGGGENALARHAVAALLNSTNGDVDYPYSTAEVIAAVQAAFASGDYETAKNMFAAANELGCDLGRAEGSTDDQNGPPSNRGRSGGN